MPLDTSTIPDRHDRTGAKVIKYFRVTGPAAYVAGGEALSFGLGTVELVLADHPTNGTDLRIVQWDYANSKLKWFDLAGAELGAVDVSTYACRLMVIGH